VSKSFAQEQILDMDQDVSYDKIKVASSVFIVIKLRGQMLSMDTSLRKHGISLERISSQP